MERKVFPITLDQLIKAAKKAKEIYGGDKYVLLSNDEEGNGYHECYFEFSDAVELLDGCAFAPYDLNPKDCVILG